MPVTSPLILFNIAGNQAIVDDILSMSFTDDFDETDTQQPDIDLTTITDEKSQYKYATYETDYWQLDGSFKFIPDNPSLGALSIITSDSSGAFTTHTPYITIEFNSDHDIEALVIRGAEKTNDYCNKLNLQLLDSSGFLIGGSSYNITPDNWEYSLINSTVSGVRTIIIVLQGTNNPYRFGRISEIDFGVLRFESSSIQSARLTEEIDLSGLTLPANTLDFTLISTSGYFSVTDPQGFYANLKTKEPLDSYEFIDGILTYMGRFYVDEWNSENENKANFKSSNVVGLLDGIKFYGDLYADYSENVIDHIITETGGNFDVDTGLSYNIDDDVNHVLVYGRLPIDSSRSALQQVCMGLGAYINTSRSSDINILPVKLATEINTPDYTLTSSDKGILSPVEYKIKVDGVQVKTHDWVDGAQLPTPYPYLFNDTLAVGSYVILLKDRPKVFSYNYGTATMSVTAWGVNHIAFNVTVAGTVIIELETPRLEQTGYYQIVNGSPDNSNIILIEDANFITRGNASDRATYLYNYLQQRYLQKTKLFASAIKPGDSVLIDSQSGKKILGYVEKMTTDLTGGMVQDVEIVGILET